MDVMDAGVYVSKWVATVPKTTQVTMWGPLAAKQMGLEGWEVQDGGETGFVMHHSGAKLAAGRATSTLIFVRRLETAYLTIYIAGYPSDAPAQQRKLDTQAAVAACELFLGRLAKQPVAFRFEGELALVENLATASGPSASRAAPGNLLAGKPGGPQRLAGDATPLGGGRTTGKRIGDAPLGGRVPIEEA